MTYSKQMDIHVFFFDLAKLLVEGFYIGLQFMGHATHEDTLRHFKKAHQGLNIVQKLLQVSMDGPNVNWKFIEVLAEHCKLEDQIPQSCSTLESVEYMLSMVSMAPVKI